MSFGRGHDSSLMTAKDVNATLRLKIRRPRSIIRRPLKILAMVDLTIVYDPKIELKSRMLLRCHFDEKLATATAIPTGFPVRGINDAKHPSMDARLLYKTSFTRAAGCVPLSFARSNYSQKLYIRPLCRLFAARFACHALGYSL